MELVLPAANLTHQHSSGWMQLTEGNGDNVIFLFCFIVPDTHGYDQRFGKHNGGVALVCVDVCGCACLCSCERK